MSAIDTVEQLYKAFAAGDGASLSTLLAETHWIEARGGPYGGIYQGFSEIAEDVFGPIGRDVQDFTAIPDELLPIANDRVLALGRYGGAADAGTLDTRFAHLWTVHDNQISQFEQFTDTHEWRAAIGG